MRVQAIKTRIVEVSSIKLTDLIFESLSSVPNNSVVAITSKVVSLCEGSVIPFGSASKDEIIENDADYFLPKKNNKYGVYLTIKNNLLLPSAGVDESNTNGNYVLWPKDPQKSAKLCRDFIIDKYKIENVGIIITDSTSSPLRLGVTGKCVSYYGFKGLNSKIGQVDLFGRKLRMTQVNVADSLAASAVLCMGESNEQTPIALIDEIPFVEFCNHQPADNLNTDINNDLYEQLLNGVKWQSRK